MLPIYLTPKLSGVLTLNMKAMLFTSYMVLFFGEDIEINGGDAPDGGGRFPPKG
jgi:hypothetical protein